ncbi:DNA cytosine methyltransferase [candidate division WOR-3 bacterium]|nr:DNA cytosine methyltransferase [candidate division WOR-3 bacterium]
MKVLVACEFSGIVRDAFVRRGHDAWSCDLLDTERHGNHIKGDVLDILDNGWDMMIAHPPCTRLAVSGAVWFKYKEQEQIEALEFVRLLLNASIPKIALENPVGVISTKIRKPDQIIQPYMFGDEAQRATCLWLKNLPPLFPTKIVDKGEIYITKNGKKRGGAWTMKLPPSPDRWKIRSRTFRGIADAMAKQWGGKTNQWWGI